MSLQSRTAFRLALAAGGLAAMVMLAAPVTGVTLPVDGGYLAR